MLRKAVSDVEVENGQSQMIAKRMLMAKATQPMRTQRRLWRGGDGGGAEVCVLRGGGSDERERVPS